MTKEEWTEVAMELEYGFKGELSDGADRIYRRHLGHYSGEQVLAALALLIRQGKTFLPTPGEIVKTVESLGRSPDPTFDEAWAIVLPALSNGSTAVASLQMRGASEVVVAWVQSYGPERMSHEPVHDPEHGGAVIHGLRQSYEQFLERAEARRAQGLPILEEGVAEKVGDLHRLNTGFLRSVEPPKQLEQ